MTGVALDVDAKHIVSITNGYVTLATCAMPANRFLGPDAEDGFALARHACRNL